MAITFRYANVPRPDGTLRHAPYVPIYIQDKKGKQIRIVSLIDSGADDTVVPKDLAILLGLSEKGNETETAGIGGRVRVKESRLSLSVRGEHEQYSFEIPVLILQDENINVPLLLGRHGFFEHFHITFKQDQQKIVLKKIQPTRS